MILRTRDDEGHGELHQLFNLSTNYEETENLYASEPRHAARLLRRVEARRGIQSNYEVGGTDSSNRYKRLTEEALENLRTLGYIR